MRHLLSRSDEPIQITDIVRIILQESEDGLRDALNSGKASPNDMIDDTSSMVDYAFGWPKGIQILLEAGATPSADNGRLPYVIDNANEDTYHSVKLLLEAGWLFSWADIYVSQTTKGSRKIKSLLINELVARRKTLWNLAQSCLPSGQLPKLISDDEKTGTTTIFDIHTAGIHDCLVKQGISINPILSRNCSKHVHCVSVYHYPFFTVETLDELYQVGFRGVTQLDWEGFMPLMIAMHNDFWSSRTDSRRRRKGMERISWLISKGADPYQKVPGTSATAAHHLGLEIVDHFLDNFHRFIVIGLDKRKQYEVWKQMVSDLAKDVFLLPSIWDGCGCACSPSGCTTMSVLLRHIVRSFSIHEFEEPSFWFRELIQFLLWWTKGDTETGWGVIRFLTFDALGLKHSCCIKNHTNYEYPHFKLESREEEEVAEILDEQKPRLMELEKLLDELKIKFDELGHPVMEFLEGYWHTRMIEVLSQRDPYDQEHIIESRRIGVTLEPDECVVPDRVSLLIGSKIMYEIST
ncbi:hypothetical protein N7471_003144 [Penicillium samsonianum]|uniref:uncharacterized protein n=1 Tax=Penicillium samsonianum TaxID=1882272 RepID=UPI002549120B|nr:uncharacterized protein N7471_003144 [Penicillium samsonianum]KAJ6143691.1 hypothetical protein N7471_003144 [Penicillium samsonianum]